MISPKAAKNAREFEIWHPSWRDPQTLGILGEERVRMILRMPKDANLKFLASFVAMLAPFAKMRVTG